MDRTHDPKIHRKRMKQLSPSVNESSSANDEIVFHIQQRFLSKKNFTPRVFLTSITAVCRALHVFDDDFEVLCG